MPEVVEFTTQLLRNLSFLILKTPTKLLIVGTKSNSLTISDLYHVALSNVINVLLRIVCSNSFN